MCVLRGSSTGRGLSSVATSLGVGSVTELAGVQKTKLDEPSNFVVKLLYFTTVLAGIANYDYEGTENSDAQARALVYSFLSYLHLMG